MEPGRSRTRPNPLRALRRSAGSTLRRKLRRYWPLGVAGTGGAALAAILGFQSPFHSLDHFSSALLFTILSTVALVVGIVAFAAVREKSTHEPSRTNARGRNRVPVLANREGRRRPAPGRWNGRPVPHVTQGLRESVEPPRSQPTPSWSPEEESEEIATPLRLEPEWSEPSERPSTWNKGRLLRLSEDGALTVYSLDDALRDLEVVSQTVHGRRLRRGENAANLRRPSSG